MPAHGLAAHSHSQPASQPASQAVEVCQTHPSHTCCSHTLAGQPRHAAAGCSRSSRIAACPPRRPALVLRTAPACPPAARSAPPADAPPPAPAQRRLQGTRGGGGRPGGGALGGAPEGSASQPARQAGAAAVQRCTLAKGADTGQPHGIGEARMVGQPAWVPACTCPQQAATVPAPTCWRHSHRLPLLRLCGSQAAGVGGGQAQLLARRVEQPVALLHLKPHGMLLQEQCVRVQACLLACPAMHSGRRQPRLPLLSRQADQCAKPSPCPCPP